MTVTIIIPVYQVASYIEGCLHSVMEQTYSGDMECLLIDDCGTDDSMIIAERMMAAYEGPIRFSVFHHEKNRGLSVARNTGINAAKGDYIYFLDSDDELMPDCIEKLTKPVLEDATIEMVMGNYSICSDGCPVATFELPVLKRQEELTSVEAVRDYYFSRQGFYVYAWNKLTKKDFLIKHQLFFKEELLWEDYLWTFYVVKYLTHLYVIPDATYRYYKRKHSITTRASKKEKAHHMGLAYLHIGKNFTAGENVREAKRYVKGLCYCYAEDAMNPVFHQASSLYLKALSDRPCAKERLLLCTTVFLSKFAIGRGVLWAAATVMDRIVRL